MKRPSFQFYPDDWTGNANLRRCSPAARGVWVDVMCLMHDQEEYGILRWPLKEIAQAAGASMAHIRELVEKNVLKGIDKGECESFVYVPRSGRKDGDPVTLVPTQAGPLWYSSRMVKDEYVRTIRAEAAGNGGAPKPTSQPSPKVGFGETKGEPIGGGFGPRASPSPSPTTCIDSEAKASAAQSTAKDRVWTFGPALLGEKGRSLLGQLVNKHGEEVVDRAIASAMREQPGEPKAWLVKACETEAQLQRRAEQLGGGDLLDDPKPQWALDAGFCTRFEAENEGCTPRNAHQFRDGRRVQ